MITTETDEYGGTRVMAGKHCLTCITKQTPKEAVAKFIELAKRRSHLLTVLGREVEACREANYKAEHGKNYPVFGRMERIVSQMCREAGIIDS